MISSSSTEVEVDESRLLEDLDEVDQAIIRGDFVEALKGIFTPLKDYPNDIRPYKTAFHALSSAVAQSAILEAIPESTKHNIYKKLLLQEGCAEKPLVFHHGVANLLNSNNHATARAIAAEIEPAVAELLSEGPPSKELVIYFLIARSVFGSFPSQQSISRWHEDYFANFSASDLQLPYSILFGAKEFGANLADLLRMFPTRELALDPSRNLRLSHLLLFEWLTGRALFPESDNRNLLVVLERYLDSNEHSQSDLRAGRSLILRHWQRNSLIPDQILEKFGVNTENSLIRRVELSNEEYDEQQHRELRRLQQTSFQVFDVARGFASRIFPSIVKNQRQIRIAVCVSGQLRGFKSALQTWQKSLLAYSDFDIYVHSWSAIGQTSPRPFRSVLPFEGPGFCSEWRRVAMLEGFKTMMERYPSLFAELAKGSNIDEEALTKEYSIKKKRATVVIEDETESRFANFTNQDKMHYKIHASHELAVNSGEEYDLFVRIRPDLPIKFLAYDWRNLAKICQTGPVIFCDHPLGVHYGKPMIGDQLAVGSPQTMKIYAATWCDFNELKNLELAEFPKQLSGHVSLAQQCWLNRIFVNRIPAKIGSLLDPAPLSCRKIRTTILEDSNNRSDKIDRALLNANAEDSK